MTMHRKSHSVRCILESHPTTRWRSCTGLVPQHRTAPMTRRSGSSGQFGVVGRAPCTIATSSSGATRGCIERSDSSGAWSSNSACMVVTVPSGVPPSSGDAELRGCDRWADGGAGSRWYRAPMRDSVGPNERIFAWYYPFVVGLAERAGLRETRRTLFCRAEGRTLEIGAGTGLNLPHYTPAVSELVVTEPNSHMLAHLRLRLGSDRLAVGAWQLVQTGAEVLPFEDGCFDTVTAAFVQCTIPDPATALAEIARVLRPGGRLLFLEHVRAPEGSRLG